MKNNQIRLVIILGILAISGILFLQIYWLRTAFNIKERQFTESIHIALLNVAENIATENNGSLANEDIVNQLSSDYFVVNINDIIDANVLEYYLTNEFEKHKIGLDFEYAIHDCRSDEMVYGKYVNVEDDNKEKANTELPKYDEYIYYFGVNFPTKAKFVISNLRFGLVFSGLLFIALAFFGYALYIIIAQKRLSDLQTDFINNMTHEFKTPISSIGLSTDVLLKNKEIGENEKTSKYLNIIKDQTFRLNRQVEKVLQIAKIQQGEFEFKKEPIDLIPFLENLIHTYSVNYEQKNGKIIFEKPQEEITILADKFHLTNIIYNLLDNALKYNINVPISTIKLERMNNKVHLSIADNGIGISQQYLDKIFERFFRVPTGDIHNVKGFGLGLFYVKKIVDLHKWTIKIDSKIDEGTIIKIKM